MNQKTVKGLHIPLLFALTGLAMALAAVFLLVLHYLFYWRWDSATTVGILVGLATVYYHYRPRIT